jgi:hypothetical protein
MSLPASQQRVLDAMESALKRREPRLASMFAIFTRLTHNEGLPRTEVLERVRWWSARRVRARLPGPVALLVPLAVALVVSAVILGITGSPRTCTMIVGRSPVASQVHTPTCPAVPPVKGFGHGP